MSLRLKQGMREIIVEAERTQNAREEVQMNVIAAAIRDNGAASKAAYPVQVTQNIYAKETSYVAQQREAVRNFRQIARAMG